MLPNSKSMKGRASAVSEASIGSKPQRVTRFHLKTASDASNLAHPHHSPFGGVSSSSKLRRGASFHLKKVPADLEPTAESTSAVTGARRNTAAAVNSLLAVARESEEMKIRAEERDQLRVLPPDVLVGTSQATSCCVYDVMVKETNRVS